jgi:NAD(P)-dependent dehydrogenase (short-subunit alcohol dehydrogenase family)
MPSKWRVAWVTGASSGIGREVAIQLAAKGVKVAASARSADKLQDMAKAAPLISAFPLDVTDLEATRRAAGAIEQQLGPIDLAILNAGAWEPTSARKFDAAAIARTTAVNYQGVVNGIDALLPRMLARHDGHLAFVASVAGYRGLPRSAAYGPMKAALINLAETLRTELAPEGVVVSVVNPGFVATPMTAVNKFPMPFIQPVEAAAAKIVSGLESRKFEVAGLLKLARVLPYPLFFRLARRAMPRKPGSGD